MSKQMVVRNKSEHPRGWQKVTPAAHAKFKAALDAQFGKDRPRFRAGPKPHPEKRYVPTFIKFHPQIVAWAKSVAKKRGIGYQTVINETLLGHTAETHKARWF